jgi:hypothetical protein
MRLADGPTQDRFKQSVYDAYVPKTKYSEQFKFVFNRTKDLLENDLELITTENPHFNSNDQQPSYLMFGLMVCTNCEWDAKRWLVNEFENTSLSPYVFPVVEGGDEYYYDIHGNIIYGYIGSAAGISDDALLDNAGTMNLLDDFISPNRNITSQPGVDGWRKFDDPRDQSMIQVGINLWNKYQNQLNIDQLYQAIINSGIPSGVP